MTAQPADVEVSMIDQMACPSCGHENTHQGEVRVFTRPEEDGPGLATTVSADRVSVRPQSGGFVGRRDDVRIEFRCEGCPDVNWLYIVQHKGTTFVRWQRSSECESVNQLLLSGCALGATYDDASG